MKKQKFTHLFKQVPKEGTLEYTAASFDQWKDKKLYVRKGEKAYTTIQEKPQFTLNQVIALCPIGEEKLKEEISKLNNEHKSKYNQYIKQLEYYKEDCSIRTYDGWKEDNIFIIRGEKSQIQEGEKTYFTIKQVVPNSEGRKTYLELASKLTKEEQTKLISKIVNKYQDREQAEFNLEEFLQDRKQHHDQK